MYIPTPIQRGHGPADSLRKKGDNAVKIKMEPYRDQEENDDDEEVFDDVDTSTDSVMPCEDDDEDDAYEEFLTSEVKDYSLYIDRASGDIHCWKMENADHTDNSLHFTRTIRENMDLKDDEEFWANAFYTMARCELSIQRDIKLGNNKAGQEVDGAKGATQYSRRYRAIMAAVRHTRNGKVSSEEYAHKAAKKKGRRNSNKETSVSNTPRTHSMRDRIPKRKLSGSDAKSDHGGEPTKTEECRKKLKVMH